MSSRVLFSDTYLMPQFYHHSNESVPRRRLLALCQKVPHRVLSEPVMLSDRDDTVSFDVRSTKGVTSIHLPQTSHGASYRKTQISHDSMSNLLLQDLAIFSTANGCRPSPPGVVTTRRASGSVPRMRATSPPRQRRHPNSPIPPIGGIAR